MYGLSSGLKAGFRQSLIQQLNTAKDPVTFHLSSKLHMSAPPEGWLSTGLKDGGRSSWSLSLVKTIERTSHLVAFSEEHKASFSEDPGKHFLTSDRPAGSCARPEDCGQGKALLARGSPSEPRVDSLSVN